MGSTDNDRQVLDALESAQREYEIYLQITAHQLKEFLTSDTEEEAPSNDAGEPLWIEMLTDPVGLLFE